MRADETSLIRINHLHEQDIAASVLRSVCASARLTAVPVARRSGAARRIRSAPMTQHKTAIVDGLSVFYREAGRPGSPKLVLLGGFPASSHQFRNLIPALAERFHVLSADYPGFGNTDMPDPANFHYTFDRLSEVVEGLLTKTGFTRAGYFMQDYGGPVGFRVLGRHPEWMEWL